MAPGPQFFVLLNGSHFSLENFNVDPINPSLQLLTDKKIKIKNSNTVLDSHASTSPLLLLFFFPIKAFHAYIIYINRFFVIIRSDRPDKNTHVCDTGRDNNNNNNITNFSVRIQNWYYRLQS